MNEYFRILAKLRGGSYKPSGSRVLHAVTGGMVFPAGELISQSGRLRGEGYAVIPTAGRRCDKITLVSPDDAVVTEILHSGVLKMRNGNGVMLELHTGIQGVDWLADIGSKLCCGDVICRIPRGIAKRSRFSGAFAVLFCAPEQITELHIPSAKRRMGEPAAYYLVR